MRLKCALPHDFFNNLTGSVDNKKLKHASLKRIRILGSDKIISYNVIKLLIRLIGISDTYTAGHSQRVTEYAVGFAEYMGYSREEIYTLKWACVLHDIGKIGISKDILNKPGRLTEEEFKEIKRHPEIGYNVLKGLGFFEDEANIIRHHHERIDGKGYPDGIDGGKICELSKVLSICDSFDAMTSHRVYRDNFTIDDAVQELLSNSGTQFDQKIVHNFVRYIGEYPETRENTI